MLATTLDRCHRCLEPLDGKIHFVGDDYCAACRRDMKVREEADRQAREQRSQFKVIHPGARAKELWPQGAA